MLREVGSKTRRQRRFNGRADSMVKPMLKKSEDLDLGVLILGIKAVIALPSL